MYRGLFLFSFEFLLYGINVYWWRRVGINHIHICDFHHRKHLGPYQILEVSECHCNALHHHFCLKFLYKAVAKIAMTRKDKDVVLN